MALAIRRGVGEPRPSSSRLASPAVRRGLVVSTGFRRPPRRRAPLFAAFLAVVGAIAVAASCARRPPAPPEGPLGAAEIERRLSATAAETSGIRRYQAIFSVRGESLRGAVRGRGGGDGFSGRLLVLFERPPAGFPGGAGDPAAVAALRISAFAPVGGVRWSLVARPGSVRAVALAARVFAEGSDLRVFTEPLFGLPVGLREVAAVVSGSGVPLSPVPPVGIAVATPAPTPTADGGARLASGARIWWAPPPAGAGDAARVRRARGADYEVRYPEAASGSGRPPPRRLEIEGERVRARLTVEELQVNARLHPDSFRLPVPDGFRQRSVSGFLEAMRREAR